MKKPRNKDNKVKYGTVSLPLPLIDMVKEKIKGTGMPSVSAYVAFVLRQILSSSPSKTLVLNKDEEKELKIRLKKLGYT